MPRAINIDPTAYQQQVDAQTFKNAEAILRQALAQIEWHQADFDSATHDAAADLVRLCHYIADSYIRGVEVNGNGEFMKTIVEF